MFRMNEISGKYALKLWAVLLVSAAAFGQSVGQKPKIICDHAAPPAGMHYVCKSQCDCHLEGKLKNHEDGVAPAATDPPRFCSQRAPQPGKLLVCDSECRCSYVAQKRKPKKPGLSSKQ